MLLVDPSSREAVANQADAGGQLRSAGGVFVGKVPADVNLANTATQWAGVEWTMILWSSLPEVPYARGRLMMHECFHRVQEELGLPATNPGNNHLDARDGRIWLQMEWRALSEALIRSGADRRRAAEDALVFRAYRRTLFPSAAAEERGLEMNEGLAEYTGYRLCGLPEGVLPDRVAIRLDEQPSRGGSFVRNFAYVSGPAYGLLLDAADTGWRRNLKERDDLGQLLGAAMRIQLPADLTAEANRRCQRYDGRRLIARETERDSRRRERLAGYAKRFVEGPVLVLPLGSEVSYSYDPNGIEAFDDASSVYATARVTDAWGILEVAGGALVTRRDGRVAEVRVPAPTDPKARPLAGDGWTLQLNAGWKLVAGARTGDYLLARSE